MDIGHSGVLPTIQDSVTKGSPETDHHSFDPLRKRCSPVLVADDLFAKSRDLTESHIQSLCISIESHDTSKSWPHQCCFTFGILMGTKITDLSTTGPETMNASVYTDVLAECLKPLIRNNFKAEEKNKTQQLAMQRNLKILNYSSFFFLWNLQYFNPTAYQI